ncbi:MAG: 2,3-bisphosphoglycerate-independent phosphoglycerate mutase [Planctomycetota bacterium]|nr:MAG: 2,3-bisphosphoglycerate-independent phosphoglycerate mutase [Planctomycetota bacterium]
MSERPRPVALIVLDGWGIDGLYPNGDATSLADTRTMRTLRERFPHAQLLAAGDAVGLPPGVIGNSEVGHLNLGAGRVVYQDLTRIDRAIADGSFFENETLRQCVDAVADRGGRLHLAGLLSDAGVHAHMEHVFALLELAHRRGLREVWVHAFTDGRDSDPRAGVGYVRRLLERMDTLGCGRLATLCGRYWAMDRDRRWDRTARAYAAIVCGEAPLVPDPIEALERSYEAGVTDEFVEPVRIAQPGGEPPPVLANGDGFIFWNFRADRARQLSRTLLFDAVEGFERPCARPQLTFVSMTRYDKTFPNPVAFAPERLEHLLGEEVAARGWRQLRVAETEKYAHVTYFINGGREEPFPGEERILVPSRRDVPTYDLVPEMRANEITDEAIARLRKGPPVDLLVLNYANADMVGHTGNLEATERAVEATDRALGRLLDEIRLAGGVAIVTADHGNAEQMIDPETGAPHTAHTTAPVPIVLVDPHATGRRLASGKLADVAPTVLDLLGLPKPAAMTGRSLLEPPATRPG